MIFGARLVQFARIKVETSAMSPSVIVGLTPRPGIKA